MRLLLKYRKNNDIILLMYCKNVLNNTEHQRQRKIRNIRDFEICRCPIYGNIGFVIRQILRFNQSPPPLKSSIYRVICKILGGGSCMFTG